MLIATFTIFLISIAWLLTVLRDAGVIKAQWALVAIRPVVSIYELFMEFLCVRIENGSTSYKFSMKKIWFEFGQIAFNCSWIVKIFYMKLGPDWKPVADALSTELILGLGANAIATATAYIIGKRDEMKQPVYSSTEKDVPEGGN